MVDNNTKIRKLNIITMLQLLVPINIISIRISLSCAIHHNGIMIDMLTYSKPMYIEVYLHIVQKSTTKAVS